MPAIHDFLQDDTSSSIVEKLLNKNLLSCEKDKYTVLEVSMTRYGQKEWMAFTKDGSTAQGGLSGEPFISYGDNSEAPTGMAEIAKKSDAMRLYISNVHKKMTLLPYVIKCEKYFHRGMSIGLNLYCDNNAVKFYAYLGRYDDAISFVNKYIDFGVFNDNEGIAVIKILEQEKSYTLDLLTFIQSNPGFYQRKISKELPNMPKDWRTDFLYFSPLINREPVKGSYYLYLNEDEILKSDFKFILT